MEMRGVLGSGMLAHTEDLQQVWLSRCVSIASTNPRVLRLVSPMQIRRVSATEVTETKNIVNMVVVLDRLSWRKNDNDDAIRLCLMRPTHSSPATCEHLGVFSCTKNLKRLTLSS